MSWNRNHFWLSTTTMAALSVGAMFHLESMQNLAHQWLLRCWAGYARQVAKTELTELADQLSANATTIQEIRDRRDELNSQREELVNRQAACQAGLKENQAILAEIHDLLRSQPGHVQVGADTYERSLVTADAERYLQRCEAEEEELRQIEPRITELSAMLSQLDEVLAEADRVLDSRRQQLSRLKQGVELRELRGEVAELAQRAKETIDGAADWSKRTEHIEKSPAVVSEDSLFDGKRTRSRSAID